MRRRVPRQLAEARVVALDQPLIGQIVSARPIGHALGIGEGLDGVVLQVGVGLELSEAADRGAYRKVLRRRDTQLVTGHLVAIGVLDVLSGADGVARVVRMILWPIL